MIFADFANIPDILDIPDNPDISDIPDISVIADIPHSADEIDFRPLIVYFGSGSWFLASRSKNLLLEAQTQLAYGEQHFI